MLIFYFYGGSILPAKGIWLPLEDMSEHAYRACTIHMGFVVAAPPAKVVHIVGDEQTHRLRV